MRFVRNRDSGEIFYIDVCDRERPLKEVPGDELRIDMQCSAIRMVPMTARALDTMLTLDGLADAAFQPLRRYGDSVMAMARRAKRRLRSRRARE
jgi:hypothetical protein